MLLKRPVVFIASSPMGISYFMGMLSLQDDLVFDPMVETGDVLNVAKSLNRRAIGIEMDSE